MTTSREDIPEDLARFRNTYVELFGMLPPLPAARFEFSSEINPEFLRLSERLRAHAFYSDVFDIKTTHLVLFGMLLVEHNAAAQMHALAAVELEQRGRSCTRWSSSQRQPSRLDRPTKAAPCLSRCATKNRKVREHFQW